MNINFGFLTSKEDGSLALHVGDNYEKVIKNREYLAKKIGKQLTSFVYMNQVHGSKVVKINELDKGKGAFSLDDAFNCDAMLTDKKGIVLMVLVADCVPVIFYDYKKQVIGIAHAGWKGASENISAKVVNEMINCFDSNTSDIKIIIGPSIKQCSYEVGANVSDQFNSKYLKQSANGKKILDIRLPNKQELLDIGILESNIEMIDVDTFVNKNYFSARREGFDTGRFGMGIYL